MNEGSQENAALLEQAGNENSIMAMIRQAKEGVETTFDVVRELDGDGKETGKTLVIQRREMQPERPDEPRRAESLARSHRFHSADTLADYLQQYATDQCVIVADVDSEEINAVLNENDTLGRELVSMKPAIHPKLKPWIEMIDKSCSIQALATFVMQNRRTIIEPDPKDMAILFHNLRMSKAVTIDNGKGQKAINGISIETTIQGKKQNEFVELPETIKLLTPIYVGTAPVEFEIDLLIHSQGGDEGKVMVDITSSDLTDARITAFEQMLKGLKQVRDNVVTGFGRLDYADWKYLPQK